MLNRIEAAALLDWAHAQNPGPWRAHSLHVARAAGAIAEKCGMDGERAWVLGALHDVGRYEGVRGLHHAVAGYALLMEKGDPGAARVCVTHSFPDGRLEHFNGKRDVSPEEGAFLRRFLAETIPDDFDRLIQLCDAICTAQGVCLMEKRLVDVALRHGLEPGLDEKWRAFLNLRRDFERRMGASVYSLFDECAAVTFAAEG